MMSVFIPKMEEGSSVEKGRRRGFVFLVAIMVAGQTFCRPEGALWPGTCVCDKIWGGVQRCNSRDKLTHRVIPRQQKPGQLWITFCFHPSVTEKNFSIYQDLKRLKHQPVFFFPITKSQLCSHFPVILYLLSLNLCIFCTNLKSILKLFNIHMRKFFFFFFCSWWN